MGRCETFYSEEIRVDKAIRVGVPVHNAYSGVIIFAFSSKIY